MHATLDCSQMVRKGEKSNENIEEEPLECEEASQASDETLRFGEASQASDETLRFSDCHSNCAAGSDYEDCRRSDGSDCSIEIDLESGLGSPHKVERICRICHLSLEGAAAESGVPIVLGCSCKDDLAAAHKQCAETWFKIRGNKTCEICGSIACNVVDSGETEFIDQWNEANNSTNTTATPATEARRFWQGHRFLNFLLACMVFAFVISWLFHFTVPG